ncbi:hypothetical protein Acr_22g0007280 [Actinidia rufa]|uniref:Uncharacterized protein n=1 Tax=Actinidia rufa TaxID=165716 RepID=A0A7J0GKL6_9ERIC|nr:hypothetical protein Acr_22g0007280 [Actinidia rufa]
MDNLTIFGNVQFLRQRNKVVVIRDEREYNAIRLSEVPSDNVISKFVLAQRTRREREKSLKCIQPTLFPNLTPRRRRRRNWLEGSTNTTNVINSTSVPTGVTNHVPKRTMVTHHLESTSLSTLIPRTPDLVRQISGRTPITVDSVVSHPKPLNQEDLHAMPPQRNLGESFLAIDVNEVITRQVELPLRLELPMSSTNSPPEQNWQTSTNQCVHENLCRDDELEANAFTSLGAKMDPRILAGRGPRSFTIHGELRHRTGALLSTTWP